MPLPEAISVNAVSYGPSLAELTMLRVENTVIEEKHEYIHVHKANPHPKRKTERTRRRDRDEAYESVVARRNF